MILCLNANAAIDKTVVVNHFRLNEIHRPESVLALPGGKGVNVARGLQRLGESPLVMGWVGGFNGHFIDSGLQQEGIKTSFVRLESESRTCLSVLDLEGGTLTEIYEKGDTVPAEKIEELVDAFRSILSQCSAVTLSGSLPPGVPSDFYARLLTLAKSASVPAFLDSGGSALKEGLEQGKPFLIKPNAKEFAELAGVGAENPENIPEMAVKVALRWETIVALSLGADGVLVTDGREVLRVCPPRVGVLSAVGSGDCLLAGMTYAFVHNLSLSEAARYGVAAGTANALSVGAGMFTMDDFSRILSQVTIESA